MAITEKKFNHFGSDKIEYTKTFVMLQKGDTHEHFNFVSRGAGSIIIGYNHRTDELTWTEFDANDPKFIAILISTATNGMWELEDK